MLEPLKLLFPDSEIKDEDLERYKRARGLYIEDPWDRVKSIFQLNEFNEIHPELARAIHAGQVGLITGGIIGGVKEAGFRAREFVRTNDTNVYTSKHEMYRIMSNKSIQSMFKGAFKLGPKCGLFVGGFMLAASCCEAYRNKPGIIEYVVGGYIAGGISRSAFGIKGFTAGSIIGATLGLITGLFRVGVEKVTNTDTLSLKYSEYALIKHRKKLYEKIRGEPTPTDKLIGSLHGVHTTNPLDELKEEKNK